MQTIAEHIPLALKDKKKIVEIDKKTIGRRKNGSIQGHIAGYSG
jgi:hypothetical protein